MANEKEDVLKANAGAPAADIPDLKKKEKERKKAGAAWSGARGAAGEFSGATGGNVARAAASAASAAEGAAFAGAEAIEGGGGLWGAISRFFAGLMSTALGKLAVGAAAFLMMAAAGLVGYALLKGGGASVGAPNLGGISDSMKIHEGGNDRFDMAGKGEIRFDPLSKKAAAPAAPAVAAAKPAEKPAADAPTAEDAQKPVPMGLLAHNLSGAKLSSSLGGDFGSKNIFAGNNSLAPKFGAGMGNLPAIGAKKGNLSAMRSSNNHGRSTARSIGRLSSNRAIGQLRLAKGMSMVGASGGTAEQAATAANNAFDQQATDGGNLNAPGAPPDGTVAPAGSGAPDTSMPGAPSAPTQTSTDPGLENSLGQIGQMAQQAGQMQQTGEELLAAGIVLMALGAYIMTTGPWGVVIGAVILAIGAMLVGIGIMMMQMAAMMAQMAKAMGSALAAETGNQQQAGIVNYCTDQAIAGTPPANCNPPDSVTNATQQTNQDAADVNRVQQIPNATMTTGAQAQDSAGANLSGTGGSER